MEVFQGPELTPPTVSLLSSADIATLPVGRDGLPDTHWGEGFSVDARGCARSTLFPVCRGEEDVKEWEGAGGEITYKPYVAYGSDRCSTYSGRIRDMYERAEQALLTDEAYQLERQLWLGTMGGNPFLADGAGPTQTVNVTGNSTPQQALAVMDQVLADTSSNRGMIHMRPIILDQLVTNGSIRRVGNVYLSPMDNIVVPGRGYPGTGPTGQAVGATEWIYAHPGVVQIRHSEIMYTPTKNDYAAQFIRETNDRIVLAERIIHVALDTSCSGPFALEVENGIGAITYTG